MNELYLFKIFNLFCLIEIATLVLRRSFDQTFDSSAGTPNLSLYLAKSIDHDLRCNPRAWAADMEFLGAR